MDKWLIWCNLNAEQDALEKLFKGHCVSIRGNDSSDDKISRELEWREGTTPILITKPECFGWGMNWQHNYQMIFVGLSDSFEKYYQAVRRCWRFGQNNPVDVYVITAETEGAVVANIKRKEADFEKMLSGMISATQDMTKKNIYGTVRQTDEYNPQIKMIIPEWLKEEAA